MLHKDTNIKGKTIQFFLHYVQVLGYLNLQKGIYFIRFKEGSKTISKSFSKSE
jgi:hypothetical protein